MNTIKFTNGIDISKQTDGGVIIYGTSKCGEVYKIVLNVEEFECLKNN